MARRLYLGRLPPDTRPDDVQKFFDGYGRIVDCRVMTGFGFVEFENSKDAEDAVHTFNGKPFMGANILVEFAKESRPRREHYEDRGHGHGGARSRRPPGIRLLVQGVSRDTSWQDLKDFGRECGSVTFADIDRDTPGQGILEYATREDADRAIKELDGRDLRGKVVKVDIDDTHAGPDNYRRGDDRPRDDRYRDDRMRGEDRYRDDRYRDDRGGQYRRERSKSPTRRGGGGGDYDRSRRSPPRKDGYDDYPRRGYDNRRPPDSYDRRREDDRFDRRRDEREYDERAPRQANGGDGSWGR